MAENFIRVEVAPNDTVHITPNQPFKSANFTPEQACELIAALQGALDHIRQAEFIRVVSIETGTWPNP